MPTPKQAIPAALRKAIQERARGSCEYCRSQDYCCEVPYAADHILPESAGGAAALENFAWCCPGCNSHKYKKTRARDPETGEEVPLYDPRRQRWTEHFAWSSDLTEMVGLTPTGRATVAALQLNRPGVVAKRRLLLLAGRHPPPDPEP